MAKKGLYRVDFFYEYGIIVEENGDAVMIFYDEEIKEVADKKTPKMLFEMQKQTLDSFLERNAISKEQYDKSLKALKEKLL